MGLFDKLKNIFIEEELVDEGHIPVINKPIEKVEEKVVEVPKVEIEPKVEETDIISDRNLIDTNQKFKFPIIFEDDDFKEEKKKVKSVNILERETTRYEPEVRKELKNLKKSFKPSPIISPVYGVLDKNYSKDEISSKDGLSSDLDTKVDIDMVIKKAYGVDKKLELENIELDDEDHTEIDIFENIDIEENKEEPSIDEIDEKIKSIDDLLKDTNDDDFYSLVDSMYKDDEEDNDEK